MMGKDLIVFPVCPVQDLLRETVYSHQARRVSSVPGRVSGFQQSPQKSCSADYLSRTLRSYSRARHRNRRRSWTAANTFFETLTTFIKTNTLPRAEWQAGQGRPD